MYARIAWKDTEYTSCESNNSLLLGGTGCLLEESNITDPFTKPKCWIGWNKQKTPYPFIALLLTKKTVVHGLYFHIYINESMGAFTSNEITISAEGKFRGKVCAPESYHHIPPQGKDFKLMFNNIYAQKLIIHLKYAGDWILIRRIKILLGLYNVAPSFTTKKLILKFKGSFCCIYFRSIIIVLKFHLKKALRTSKYFPIKVKLLLVIKKKVDSFFCFFDTTYKSINIIMKILLRPSLRYYTAPVL